jgi:hypothetical protein
MGIAGVEPRHVASVIMNVPPHKANPSTKSQEFYGQWTRFSTEAKKSTYLKDADLVVANDTNYAELKNASENLKNSFALQYAMTVCLP